MVFCPRNSVISLKQGVYDKRNMHEQFLDIFLYMYSFVKNIQTLTCFLKGITLPGIMHGPFFNSMSTSIAVGLSFHQSLTNLG